MNINFDSPCSTKVYMFYDDATVIFYYNSISTECNHMPFGGTKYTVTFAVDQIVEIIKNDIKSNTNDFSGIGIFTIFQYNGIFHRFDNFGVSRFDYDDNTGFINTIEVESMQYKSILNKTWFIENHQDQSKITDFML